MLHSSASPQTTYRPMRGQHSNVPASPASPILFDNTSPSAALTPAVRVSTPHVMQSAPSQTSVETPVEIREHLDSLSRISNPLSQHRAQSSQRQQELLAASLSPDEAIRAAAILGSMPLEEQQRQSSGATTAAALLAFQSELQPEPELDAFIPSAQRMQSPLCVGDGAPTFSDMPSVPAAYSAQQTSDNPSVSQQQPLVTHGADGFASQHQIQEDRYAVRHMDFGISTGHIQYTQLVQTVDEQQRRRFHLEEPHVENLTDPFTFSPPLLSSAPQREPPIQNKRAQVTEVCVIDSTPEKAMDLTTPPGVRHSDNPPNSVQVSPSPVREVDAKPSTHVQSSDIPVDTVQKPARKTGEKPVLRSQRSRSDPYGEGIHGLATLGGNRPKGKPRTRRVQASMFVDDDEDDLEVKPSAKKAKPVNTTSRAKNKSSAASTYPEAGKKASKAQAGRAVPKGTVNGKKGAHRTQASSRDDSRVKNRKRTSSDEDFASPKGREASGKAASYTLTSEQRVYSESGDESSSIDTSPPRNKRARRDSVSSASPCMTATARQTRASTRKGAGGSRRNGSLKAVSDAKSRVEEPRGVRRSARRLRRPQVDNVDSDESPEEEKAESSSEEPVGTQESGSQPLVLNITAFKVRKRKAAIYPDHVRRKLDMDELSMLRIAFVKYYPPPPSNMQAQGRFERQYGREMSKAMIKGLWEKELKPWSDRWWRFYGEFNDQAREHKLAKPDNRNPKINQAEANKWAKEFHKEHGDARIKAEE